MRKYFLAAAMLMLLSANPAAAQFDIGLGYHHMDESDLSVGAIVASAGYRVPVSDEFSVIPELRAGLGINDDTVMGVDVELDYLFGMAVRLQYEFTDQFYGYLSPSYAKYEFKASTSAQGIPISVSDSSNEFGIGGGLGFRVSDTVGLELGYENIDSTDVITFGARFFF